MNVFLDRAIQFMNDYAVGALLLDIAGKSVLLLALAVCVCRCVRRASASVRHWVWFLAVMSLLCLPLSQMALPGWPGPLWTVSTDLNSGNQFTLAIDFTRQQSAPGTVPARAPIGSNPKEAFSGSAATSGIKRLTARLPAPWLVLLPCLWLFGTVLTLIWILGGQLCWWGIRRKGRRMENVEGNRIMEKLRAELGIRRPVLLLQSSNDQMPMTWGFWRPIIVLPERAEEWSSERWQVVLSHELAHVKRWDCLTQLLSRIICALYWYNPLVWVAVRQMCLERERACDDLVLGNGCKPSDYASHLVDLGRTFRHAVPAGSIGMARESGLERRVVAILDHQRNRCGLAKRAAGLLALAAIGFGLLLGACTTVSKPKPAAAWSFEHSQVAAQLRRFVDEKEAQAVAAVASEGREVLPEYKEMYAAARKGDWPAISNIWENLRVRAPQYDFPGPKDGRLHGTGWQTMLEIWGAFGNIANGEEAITLAVARDIVATPSRGSIYFGGTDPGRCVITGLQKSHVHADPFFTVTQNALADDSYLGYVRGMYGGQIYVPTEADSQSAYAEYLKDAERRWKENKLKSGENVRMVDGKVQVTGQVAVMAINALIAKVIFDKNPEREFYLEESFPLDWMYPHLSPAGPILKINRQPLSELSEEMFRNDRAYWARCLPPMIGDWLKEDTSIEQIVAFARKKYSPAPTPDIYNHADGTRRWVSKLRCNIAGVYAWRSEKTSDEGQRIRLIREADFAFRQAIAVCPYSPEAVFRYANLLVGQDRFFDALRVAEIASKLQPDSDSFRNLIKEVKAAAAKK